MHVSTLLYSQRSSIGGQGTPNKIDPGQKSVEPVHVHIISDLLCMSFFYVVILYCTYSFLEINILRLKKGDPKYVCHLLHSCMHARVPVK